MNPCVIDWSLVGVWAQVAAILVTGSAGVIVAYVQLNRFNENARMTNTIKVLDDLYKPVPMLGQSISPWEALGVTVDLAENDASLTQYRQTGTGLQAPADSKEHEEQRTTAIVASNYFVTMGDLVERNLVDETFIMEKLCTLIFRTYDAVIAMHDIATAQNLRMFARLAKKARAYDEAMPAFDPANPDS